MKHVREFLLDENGQSLIEYTILMTWVVLASVALFMGVGRSMKGVWSTTNHDLTAANTSAS